MQGIEIISGGSAEVGRNSHPHTPYVLPPAPKSGAEYEGGDIEAKHALIGALLDGRRRVVRVVILDARERRGSEAWKACRLTYGACCSDWMTNRYSTPEWVFSELAVATGFADAAVMEQALAAFGRIVECGWARAMAPSEPAAKPAWVLP